MLFEACKLGGKGNHLCLLGIWGACSKEGDGRALSRSPGSGRPAVRENARPAGEGGAVCERA